MKLTRRNFLKGSAAATASGLVSTPLAASPLSPSDHKALVVVFLFGGNDAFNTIIPLDRKYYRAYRRARRDLKIPKENVLNTTLKAGSRIKVGINDAMRPLMPHFRRGDATVLLNSGQLIEPTRIQGIENNTVELPEFLMAHNLQQDMWQTGTSNFGSELGWAGRMLDRFTNTSAAPSLFSLFGENKLMRGESVRQSVLKPEGVGTYPSWGQLDGASDGYFGHFMEEGYENLYSRQYAKTMRDGVLENNFLNTALTDFPASGNLPESRLGQQLGMVERLIQAREALGQNRQVFFVGMGGFDTHHDQASVHPVLLQELAESLSAFQNSLNDKGLSDSVTTITMSEFGRRAQANETGTDHGWGGHQIVLGGSVNGDRAYGRFPSLRPNSSLNYENGRIIPTMAADRVNASLCRWFGLPEDDIFKMFPNTRNFSRPYVDFI
ncbi:DUF1501 domain-containing protein [Enterovibrio calviensis]|uniref:DUF1501 domain-containing protein n=1 Tax=Enterovibrio calviensis TaxID=91359 RepID=UPI00048998CB|nr:DUF1501 domain-containing protein [Enterovibrio calviensis]